MSEQDFFFLSGCPNLNLNHEVCFEAIIEIRYTFSYKILYMLFFLKILGISCSLIIIPSITKNSNNISKTNIQNMEIYICFSDNKKNNSDKLKPPKYFTLT